MDARYRTIPDRDHRGIQGKSSGGYGALVTPMLRPDVFSALASHAGDALFEACYLPEFREERPRAPRPRTRARTTASGRTSGRAPPSRSRRTACSSTTGAWPPATRPTRTGRSASRSTSRPGKLIDDVWQRWLDKDPVRMIPTHADELRSMRAIWVDGGTQRRVVPGQRRGRGLEGARGARRRAHARAVRRRTHVDRLPLPAVARVPRDRARRVNRSRVGGWETISRAGRNPR